MQVVGYLHNDDFLLEDAQGVMVIGGGHYVLSVGDHVILRDCLDHQKQRYTVSISFAQGDVDLLHEDEMTVKFEGCRTKLQQYLKSTTVH